MTVKQGIIGMLVIAAVLAVPLQVVIDPSTVNAASALIVCVSSVVTLLYIGLSKAIAEKPISAFAILGFCATTQLGALLVQTFSWVPLRASLYTPMSTFATMAGYLMVAIVTHALYRYFSPPAIAREGVVRRFLAGAGIYVIPTPATLWWMGLIGVIGLALQRFDNIVGKIGQAFIFLAWAPFLIPLFVREVGKSYTNVSRSRVLLGIFAVSLALVGVAFNMRGVMFTGVATVGLLYLLAGLRSDAPVTGKTVAWVGAGLAMVMIASGPMADLATSMVIARQFRGKVSASEMLRTTLRVYSQPGLVEAFRAEEAAKAQFGSYDEHYINNPLLARFVNTKYDDNALHFAAGIKTDSAKQALDKETIKFMWGTLPAPVLKLLRVNVDKETLALYSMSDYIAYLSRGIPLHGTHRLGSLFAHGGAVFGPLFPFVYALICLCLYPLMDLLSIPHRGGRTTLSALGMLLTWNFFISGLTQEALNVVVVFLIRYFIQLVVIYFAVLTAIRIGAALLAPLTSPGTALQRAQ